MADSSVETAGDLGGEAGVADVVGVSGVIGRTVAEEMLGLSAESLVFSGVDAAGAGVIAAGVALFATPASARDTGPGTRSPASRCNVDARRAVGDVERFFEVTDDFAPSTSGSSCGDDETPLGARRVDFDGVVRPLPTALDGFGDVGKEPLRPDDPAEACEPVEEVGVVASEPEGEAELSLVIGVANAIPVPAVAMATPTPSDTANAPTRPT